jgi:hypothetical protein
VARIHLSYIGNYKIWPKIVNYGLAHLNHKFNTKKFFPSFYCLQIQWIIISNKIQKSFFAGFFFSSEFCCCNIFPGSYFVEFITVSFRYQIVFQKSQAHCNVFYSGPFINCAVFSPKFLLLRMLNLYEICSFSLYFGGILDKQFSKLFWVDLCSKVNFI